MKPSLLDTILAPGGLTTLFQPIWDIRGKPKVVAVECLSRGPRGSTLEAPDVLFEYARRRREEALVDRAAASTALLNARSLPADLLLQINVHASTLGRDSAFATFFEEAAASWNLDLSRLLVEVIEESDIIDERTFLASIAQLREMGVRIAIDDVGRGRSDLRMLVLVRPDEIKIDRELVDGCASDPIRAEVVGALATLAARWESLVVAEGVERQVDLDAVRDMGIACVQGYLLARPMDAAAVNKLLAEPS